MNAEERYANVEARLGEVQGMSPADAGQHVVVILKFLEDEHNAGLAYLRLLLELYESMHVRLRHNPRVKCKGCETIKTVKAWLGPGRKNEANTGG